MDVFLLYLKIKNTELYSIRLESSLDTIHTQFKDDIGISTQNGQEEKIINEGEKILANENLPSQENYFCYISSSMQNISHQGIRI